MVDVLVALSEAVATEGPMAAVRAASNAVDAGTRLLDLVRAAVQGYGDAVDFDAGFVPHGLLAMSAAVRVAPHLQLRMAPLPILQAVALMARDPKRAGPRPRSSVITGEITHLARSFEVAVRTRNTSDAVAVFGGFLGDADEKKMAGDTLFRVAAEDASDGGHRLLLAVKAWQLAGFVGWKYARPVVLPAVSYVASGVPDTAAQDALLRAWGKAQVDLESVSRNALPVGDHALEIARSLVAATPDECARGLVDVLKAGVAIDSLAEAIIVEAARRLVAAKRFDFPAIHDVLYADASAYVATFSRTSSRVFPVLHAALRIRGKPVGDGALPEVGVPGEGELLCALSGDIDHGSADIAAARADAYVGREFPGPRLIELLCHHASRDTPTVDQGHALALADAVAEGFTRSRDPKRAALVAALAKALAVAPHDRTMWDLLKSKYNF